MDIDHVVIWVDNAERSLEFYVNVIGLEAVRLNEFHSGHAKFPSVRINSRTILDIMERDELLPLVKKFTGSDDAGGVPINHVCLSVSGDEYASICKRLTDNGIQVQSGGENAFGAQGHAVSSSYINDLDRNVIEIRYYKN